MNFNDFFILLLYKEINLKKICNNFIYTVFDFNFLKYNYILN